MASSLLRCAGLTSWSAGCAWCLCPMLAQRKRQQAHRLHWPLRGQHGCAVSPWITRNSQAQTRVASSVGSSSPVTSSCWSSSIARDEHLQGPGPSSDQPFLSIQTSPHSFRQLMLSIWIAKHWPGRTSYPGSCSLGWSTSCLAASHSTSTRIGTARSTCSLTNRMLPSSPGGGSLARCDHG